MAKGNVHAIKQKSEVGGEPWLQYMFALYTMDVDIKSKFLYLNYK